MLMQGPLHNLISPTRHPHGKPSGCIFLQVREAQNFRSADISTRGWRFGLNWGQLEPPITMQFDKEPASDHIFFTIVL
jgi:hypothetical protein